MRPQSPGRSALRVPGADRAIRAVALPTNRRLVGTSFGVTASVLVCGAVFDGISEDPRGPSRDPRARWRDRRDRAFSKSPDGPEVIDLSERTVSPGFIDTHVHGVLSPYEALHHMPATDSTPLRSCSQPE